MRFKRFLAALLCWCAWPAAASAAEPVLIEPHGHITEYRLASVNLNPWSIAVDDKGRIWVTLDETREIGMLDPKAGTLTRMPAPHALPYHLAVRDGEVWYTDFDLEHKANPGRIYRLKPETGESHAFPLPDPNGGPAILAFGPDGSVWVSEMLAGRLARLDPSSGSFTRGWEPPAADRVNRQRFPFGFTFDGQGRIWLAEAGTSRVWRIGPGGESRVYPMPQGFWGPSVAAIGPDGKVWVPGHGTSLVAALDPESGEVALWPVHPPADGFPVARPSDLRFGKNGEVWTMEHEGNRLARILPAEKTVVEYELPVADALSEWIDLDREGNVWYAARGTGRVGMVSVGAPYYTVEAELAKTTLRPGEQVRGSLTVTAHGSVPATYQYELTQLGAGFSAAFDGSGRFTLAADNLVKPGEYPLLLGVRTQGILAATPVIMRVEPPTPRGAQWVLGLLGWGGGALLVWFLIRRRREGNA